MQSICVLLILGSFGTFAQPIQPTKITNQEVISFANNCLSVSEHRAKIGIIRIYKVGGGVSAYAQETDEIDQFLYVAISGYGEGKVPRSLYKSGPFYQPSAFSFGKDDKTGRGFFVFNYLTKEKK